MPASCRIVKKPEDITAVAAALQRSGAVNAVLRRFPHMGEVIRLINPAADMVDENLARHAIAHNVLREDRQTAAIAALSLIAKDKPIMEHFPNATPEGMVSLKLKSGNKSVTLHINDLLEGKKNLRRFDLTPEQRTAIDLRKGIWDDLRFDFNRFGGRMSIDEDLFPRQVEGWIDSAGKMQKGDEFSVKSRYGGSPLSKGGSFTRSRAMNPDGTIKSAEQMVAEGWRYLDPDAALHAKGIEIARRTADAQFIQWLINEPGVLKKADILGKGVQTGVHPGKYGMYGFDANEAPGLAGYYGTKEQVEYVNRLLSVEKKAVIPGVTWLVNESRGAIASADFGTTGVQLLNSFGADVGHFILSAVSGGKLSKPSNIFGTAVFNSFKSFFHEDNLARYYADNKSVIDRWSTQLGGLKNSEYVSKMLNEPNSSLVMRLPLMQRFGRAFESSLDVAKIEYVKSLEKILGENISAEEKEALGAWVRNSTGMTSTARLGVSPRQQDIEATWLFFSPRFTRSLFATTSTIFKLDKAGAESRLALGGLMAGATGVYLAAAAALGQTPDLEPLKNGRLNPDFFTVRIGENRVGIGGGVRAMSRLMADSYESARHDPTRFISPDFKGNHSNPFLSFWRSRSSPLTGTILDIWNGEDFRGHPIVDGNDYLKAIQGRVFPFGLQAAMEASGSNGTKAGVALLSGFGLNTNPVSAYAIYDEYLKSVRTADGTQRFPDGANTANSDTNKFKLFLQVDPQAQHLKDQMETSRLQGSASSAHMQEVLNQRKTRIEAADKMLAETGNYRLYRSQINAIRADSRKTMEDLHLASLTSSGDKKIVSSWYKTYDDPRTVDPVTGGIDSDGLETVQNEWKTANPGSFEHLIEPSQRIGETRTETMLRNDRGQIADAGWWDTDKNSWDYITQGLKARGRGQKLHLDDYANYADYQVKKRKEWVDKFTAAGKTLPELRADIKMARDPLAKMFNKIRTKERLILQRDNPGLTELLNKWGYNHTSLIEFRMANRQLRQGLLPSPEDPYSDAG